MTHVCNQDGPYFILLCSSSDATNCNGNINLRGCAGQAIGKQKLLYATPKKKKCHVMLSPVIFFEGIWLLIGTKHRN